MKNMQAATLLSISVLCFLAGSECLSQIVVDAGNDTAVCADIVTLTIGGNPTAMGGVPPYSYTWSGSYSISQLVFTASFMLEDTTVANPIFKEGSIPDSVVLYVTVRDANDSVAIDSVSIRRSVFIACLVECRHYIDSGDSVQLGHCASGGIPPLEFSWEPAESLSDSTTEDPWAKPMVNTLYTLMITDSIGCQMSSYCRVFINPSGIGEENKRSDIHIYPNPVKDNITVAFNCPDCADKQFELYDSTGKLILRVPVEHSSITVNTKHLPAGVYLYKCSSVRKLLGSGQIIID